MTRKRAHLERRSLSAGKKILLAHAFKIPRTFEEEEGVALQLWNRKVSAGFRGGHRPALAFRFQDHGPGRLHTVIVEASSTDFVFTPAKASTADLLVCSGGLLGRDEVTFASGTREHRTPGLNLRRSVA